MPSHNEKIVFKTALKNACLELLQLRITHANQAMQEAQVSANSQEKSSAGDKYETSRAMGQIDRDLNAAQWMQAKEDYKLLENIPVDKLLNHIAPGAVFELENTFYFAATGLGTVRLNNLNVIVISCKSPLFQQLKTKQVGDSLIFNTKELKVLDVY